MAKTDVDEVNWNATAVQYIELNKQKTEAIQRVRELHKVKDDGCCSHCSEDTCWGCQEWADCRNCNCPCHGKYPCPTIKALDGEQDG